ncbi:hypothetical protein H7X69_02815 [Candidatus Saccharibacteria bacterium]|nr:hypothetical protein [Candidatus Saccharibacteria bacterium]
MKVLFVCRANVGRSQAATALYNQIHPGNSDSVGTIVDNPGEKLVDRKGAKNIIEVMFEHDIDITSNRRTQINENRINQYDKVIVMAEQKTIPDWLRDNSKTEVWTIQDPKDQDIETTRKIVREIEEKVKSL